MSDKINIMIVDDSAVIRSVLKQILGAQDDFEIVADAKDGQIALDKIAALEPEKKPHVIILDIQMPVMDGITALPKIIALHPSTRVIIASTLSQKNAEISFQALELGAVDYLPKPSIIHEGKDALTNFAHELVEKARTHGSISRGHYTPRPRPPVEREAKAEAAPEASPTPRPRTTTVTTPEKTDNKSLSINLSTPIKFPVNEDADKFTLSNNPTSKIQAFAIGSSTGGPDALNKLFDGLKGADFSRIPVFITQHMPPHFTKVLAENLSKHTGRKFKEAEDGELVNSGTIYIAPGNYHMVIAKKGINTVITLNQDAMENFCRPAVDPMIRSLSQIYGKNLLITILTGMGSDGARGAEYAHKAGATVFAQDKQSSVVGNARCHSKVKYMQESTAHQYATTSNNGSNPMNPTDFQYLAKMIVERSGISIGVDKQYLIETRLPKVARKHNINSIEELVTKLKISPFSQIATDVIDAMTTNESLFFRDTKPFDQLKRIILPKFQNRMINIWSAAASTGQEAYSTAITFEEANFKSYNILGTDISPSVIERANEGKYSQFEVQRGLAIMLLVKYFSQSGTDWQVKPTLKDKIKFKNFNLMDNYAPLGKFDVVFCRNVLIYFDKDTKKQVLEKIAQVTNPGGYLFLGSSETVFDLTTKFKQVDGEVGLFQLV